MPDSTPPTTGEILRRLDEMARSNERVGARLDMLAEKLEARYIPRGEYDANRTADDRRMKEIEKDQDVASAFRRQVIAGLMVGLFLMIAQTVVTLTFLRGG